MMALLAHTVADGRYLLLSGLPRDCAYAMGQLGVCEAFCVANISLQSSIVPRKDHS